jgi:DNA-binding MarR family transcriptional regulator
MFCTTDYSGDRPRSARDTPGYAPPVTGKPAADGDLGWALGAVLRSYLHATREALVALPGGLRGYLVLAVSGRGEPSSQLALAQHLGVDRTVMTYLLDDLEAAGLVERRPDPADRRARRVLLTDAGRTRLHELKARLQGVEDDLLAPLEGDERDVLRGLLTRVATAVAPANPCELARELAAAAPERPRRRRRPVAHPSVTR